MKEKLWLVLAAHRESKRIALLFAAGLNFSEALDDFKKAYPDWYVVSIMNFKKCCAIMDGDYSTELT